jgi:8-oxo-dGTP diphosphatase
MADAPLIQAAGGVLHRTRGDGPVEVAVVHRPRHDDWSLPKGKRKRGEHPVVNAHREVWEETGIHPRLGLRLPTVSYRVPVPGHGESDKSVDYWSMACGRDDGFAPGDETDLLLWLDVAGALDRLSYDRDVHVVRAFAGQPAVQALVVLLRHASAGSRHTFAGPDDERPLDPEGVTRAGVLADVLPCFGVDRLVSAEPVRCRDTLAPTARTAGVNVAVDPAFNDEAEPAAAARRLTQLAAATPGGTTVICSQGKLIPALLEQLTGGSAHAYHTAKGAGWVLGFAGDGRATAADPLD